MKMLRNRSRPVSGARVILYEGFRRACHQSCRAHATVSLTAREKLVTYGVIVRSLRRLVDQAAACGAGELALARGELFAENVEIELGAAQLREERLLLFLDVVLHVLAEHLHQRLIVLVRGPALLDARDESLDRGMLDVRFVHEVLVC